MSTIQTIGIDLAKNVFSIHGVDAYGKCVLRKTVKRNKLLEIFANLPPCLVGMEACSGAHHWARELSKLGHTLALWLLSLLSLIDKMKRTMPTTLKPYVKQPADLKHDLSPLKVQSNKLFLPFTVFDRV